MTTVVRKAPDVNFAFLVKAVDLCFVLRYHNRLFYRRGNECFFGGEIDKKSNKKRCELLEFPVIGENIGVWTSCMRFQFWYKVRWSASIEGDWPLLGDEKEVGEYTRW